MANNQMILSKVKNSAHYFDCVAIASLNNGHFVTLGARGTNGTYTVTAPAAITDLGVVIVCEVPLSYEAQLTENEFVIATGAVIRTRIPELGDVECYATANYTATATATAGHFVIIDAATSKPEIVAALGGTESIAYEIKEAFTKAGVAMIKIQCIKAQV